VNPGQGASFVVHKFADGLLSDGREGPHPHRAFARFPHLAFSIAACAPAPLSARDIYILLRKSRNSLQIAAASRAVHGACLRRGKPDCVSVKHIPGRLAPRRATRALIVSHLR